jgi:hypothetical protein
LYIYYIICECRSSERGSDRDGAFYRWGASGKKYRYTPGNAASRARAKSMASSQGRAIKTREGATAQSRTPAAPRGNTKRVNKSRVTSAANLRSAAVKRRG